MQSADQPQPPPSGQDQAGFSFRRMLQALSQKLRPQEPPPPSQPPMSEEERQQLIQARTNLLLAGLRQDRYQQLIGNHQDTGPAVDRICEDLSRDEQSPEIIRFKINPNTTFRTIFDELVAQYPVYTYKDALGVTDNLFRLFTQIAVSSQKR